MKNFVISAVALMLSTSSYASTQWVVQGETYRVDTLSHFYVGPGTTQTSLRLSGPREQRVFYTTTDLSDPNVDIKVVKGRNTTRGLETVSSMGRTRNGGATKYISGVNADFFSMGNPTFPIGNALADGTPYYIPKAGSWQSFGFTADKVPYLGTGAMKATVTAGGQTAEITSFNTPRSQNYLTLYTPQFAANTETNAYGTEVALSVVEGTMAADKTLKLKVENNPENAGNMAIPDQGYVLSGHGTGAAFVSTLKQGDIIEINTKFTFNGANAGNITQMVGGQPMILSNGEILETQGAIDHLVNREPRTAVGLSADKKKLVLLIVDGRNAQVSSGVTSKQLADIMRLTGCTEAMNFDGGGSSEMYNADFGIVNRPSGGSERAVADGVFVVSDAPQDNQIAQIRFKDPAMLFPRYAYYKPVVMAYNKYGNLINANLEGCTIECPAELGKVNDDNSVFCSGTGCHAIKATYNGLTTSMPITIGGGEPELRLTKIIEDGLHGYTAEPYAVVNTLEYPLSPQAFAWTSDNSSIATVDPQSGYILGKNNGTTTIHGKLDGHDKTIDVTVEKPVNLYAPVESPFDPASWTLQVSGGKNAKLENHENGMKVSFTGSSHRAPAIVIKKSVTLWSLPDAIRLTINPGELNITKTMFGVTSANGETRNYTFDNALTPNTTNTIEVPFSEILQDISRASYPLQLSIIKFTMKDQKTGTGYEVLIPGIETVYNKFSGVEEITANGSNAMMIFPNPAKAGEKVTVLGNTGQRVRIFSLTGSWVKDAQVTDNSFSTEGLPTGIYFVATGNKTAKLIIK